MAASYWSIWRTVRSSFFPSQFGSPQPALTVPGMWVAGSTVTPNNLGAVLAYENGVGVVEPGPDLLVRDDGVAFRPVLLPDLSLIHI